MWSCDIQIEYLREQFSGTALTHVGDTLLPPLPNSIATTLWRLLALVATVAIFWSSAVLVPGSPPSSDARVLPMPTKCFGELNGKSLDLAQLAPIPSRHAAFLATIPAPPTVRNADPYGLVTTLECEPLATVPGKADPFLASVKGTPKAVSNEGRADLCGARLTGVDLQGKDLRYVRLMAARLEDVNLSSAKFDGADLTWVAFAMSNADGAQFRWTTVPHTILGSSEFKKETFYEAGLHHAEMPGSDFTDASFDHARLNSARLRGTSLENVDFANADLSYVLALIESAVSCSAYHRDSDINRAR